MAMLLLQPLQCSSTPHSACFFLPNHQHHHSHGTQAFRRRRGAKQLVARMSIPSFHEGDGFTRRSLAALILFSIPHGAAAQEAHLTESKQLRPDAAPNLETKQNRIKKIYMQSSPWLEAKPILSETGSESASGMISPMLKIVPFFRKDKVSAENSSAQRREDIYAIFLSGLGVVGSGVLGAFYLSKHRAKVASELALKDAHMKLKSKEDVMVSLKERLERSLLAEKEALKQSEKESAVRIALLDELASRKTVAGDLQQKLNSEKSMVQKLEVKIENLQTSLKEAEEESAILEESLRTQQKNMHNLENEVTKAKCFIKDKEKEVETLHSALQEKEKLSEELCSLLQETNETLSHAKDKIQELENEIEVISKDFNDREKSMLDLKSKLAMAFGQGEEIERRLTIAQQELDFLKVSSRKELDESQTSLSSKEAEVEQLKLRLVDASKETEENNKIICDLREEVIMLRNRVSEEDLAIESLTRDLNASSQKLETMKGQVTFLSQELETLRKLKEKLDQRTGIGVGIDINSLNLALIQEQKFSSQLRMELDVTKKNVNDLKAKARSLGRQKRQFEDSYMQLKEELVSSREAAKVANIELHEQKTTKKQLELSRIVIVEAKENIKLLRKDVEVTKRELENMKKQVPLLAEKLEAANVKVIGLQEEKALLNESLSKERKLCSSLKEKASQVNVALAKLNKEKEISVEKAKKLEEELATAKAETLQLKKQVATMNITSMDANSRIQSVAENRNCL